ncbi:MAG: DUF937 domain-containing protein [Cypionkella sp.]
MNLAQQLQQSGAIGAMARELGIDEATAQRGAQALLPALVAGMGRNHVGAGGIRANAAAGGGLADVLGGLAGGGAAGGIGGGLLEAVLGQSATPTGPGNDILGQIFGSKDVSRGVAEEAAGATGISSALLKKMLPILAMAVVGSMLKGQGGSAGTGGGPAGGGMLDGILGQVVGGMLPR